MINVRKIISYILAVLLIILTTATFLLATLSITVFSKSNIKKQLSKVDYNNQIYNLVLDASNNYLMQSGFDEAIFNNVISKENINKDMDSIIDAIYDGTELNISTAEMRANLNKNIETFIEQNNYKVDNKTREDIEKFEDKIEKIYNNNIIYAKGIIEKISQYSNMIHKAITIALVVLIVMTLIFAIIIYKINRPTLGISILTTGLIFIITKFYSTINIAVNNILILNRPFSNFLTAVLNQILQNIFIVGIVLTIIGIILIVLFERMQAKNKIKFQETAQ